MLTFLFWNLARKPLHETVAQIALRHDADVIILAESTLDVVSLTIALNRDAEANGVYRLMSANNCPRIQIFSRFESRLWEPVRESRYVTLQRLSLPARPELLIGALHLPSKLYGSADSQVLATPQFVRLVEEAEAVCGHERTILVGDFNMNPYEPGMLGATGFHGMMTQPLALRRSRTIHETQYKTFYNPMWGFMGDRIPGPAGTCYYESSEHVANFWSVFDQVLVRPDLVNNLVRDSLQIVAFDGDTPLTNERGVPHRSHISDHLPLLFSLRI